MEKFMGTTILAVCRDGKTVVGGDGQVTMANTVIKDNAVKLRRLHHDKVVVGFAGAVADSFALMAKFEEKLESYNGNVTRAAVELAKEWRTSKILQRLESLMIAADKETMLLISGNGEVIEPTDKIVAIGSGGTFATAAARALMKFTELDARRIVEESLKITAEMCIYTNESIQVEEIQ